MKKKSFSDLDKDILHNILKLCVENGSSEPEAEPDLRRSEMLEDLLAESLSNISHNQSLISKHLDSFCDISGLTESVSLRALLFCSDTDISILQKIRKQGKTLLHQAKTPEMQDVATTLYYAAIASALVFHNEKISKLSKDKIWQTLSILSEATWQPSDLVKLFKRAQKYCNTLEK